MWLIFNFFSSEYFFLDIFLIPKKDFFESLRERPALFIRAEPQTRAARERELGLRGGFPGGGFPEVVGRAPARGAGFLACAPLTC